MTKPDQLNGAFGFSPRDDQHHFLVIVPAVDADQQAVTIFEGPRYEQKSASELPVGCLERVKFSREVWKSISEHVRSVFNLRLKEAKRKTGKWHIGSNFLAPHYGKELVLLGWALEDVSIEKVDIVFQNWRGLAPEERWWLYSTANAPFSQNSRKGRGLGWRKALAIALSENPLVDLPGETGRPKVKIDKEAKPSVSESKKSNKKRTETKKVTSEKKPLKKKKNKKEDHSPQLDELKTLQGSLFD
jgi:hypothetical protein